MASGLVGVMIAAALCAIPGATLGVYVRMAGFILFYPLLVASVSVPLRELILGLAGAFRSGPTRRSSTPEVLRLLGGLTWAAGLIGILGSFFAFYHATLSIDRAHVPGIERAAAVPGAIAAMLVPPMFALIVRFVLYESLAKALESMATHTRGGPSAESRLEA